MCGEYGRLGRGDGRCGRIYLMEMFKGISKGVTVKPVGNQHKTYSFMNTSKTLKKKD
jgi:hypothetical protein